MKIADIHVALRMHWVHIDRDVGYTGPDLINELDNKGSIVRTN